MQVLQSGRMLLLPEMVEQEVTVTRRAVANQETGLTGCLCTRSRIIAADADQNQAYSWSMLVDCSIFHVQLTSGKAYSISASFDDVSAWMMANRLHVA